MIKVDIIYNEELLNELCKKYNFQPVKLTGSGLIEIRSKTDTWYVLNNIYSKNITRVRLLHANRIGSAGYHFQGSFKSYAKTFAYINGHDKKYETSFDSVFNIANSLKKIYNKGERKHGS